MTKYINFKEWEQEDQWTNSNNKNNKSLGRDLMVLFKYNYDTLYVEFQQKIIWHEETQKYGLKTVKF